MSEERLTPERAVRLLRAKTAELERHSLEGIEIPVVYLAADIALVAGLLADHMDVTNATLALYVAHTENLIERVFQLEQGAHYHTKTGKVLTNEDIEALADEAERGYEVTAEQLREARDWRRTNFPGIRDE